MTKKASKLQSTVARELARRYVEFHDGKDWQSIELWGLANWGEVSKLIKSGDILTHMTKENRTIWYRPSPEFYRQFVASAITEYRNDPRADKNAQWFQGNFPVEAG